MLFFLRDLRGWVLVLSERMQIGYISLKKLSHPNSTSLPTVMERK